MTLSHTHKFIFLCNGKTGTSSIESALSPYQEGEEFEVGVPGLYTDKHIPPAALRALLGPKIWEGYFVFCFVRNPWDWFVSQYFWNQEPPPLSRKRLFLHPVRTFRRYRRKVEKRKRLRELETFTEEDIRDTYDLLRRYRGRYDADSLFQQTYVYDAGGEKLVDFVGRFEQIETDFEKAVEQIGIDASLPHRNTTDHRDYRSYYTPETAELIGELYRADVETFGYSFP